MNRSRLLALLMGGVSYVCFIPEGEGGGGSGGLAGAAGAAEAAAAAAAAGGGGDGGEKQEQQQQSGAWTPPDGLPDQFKGASADEVIGKLLPAYTGLRTQMAQSPKAPEKPDGYTFKPADEIKGYFPDPDKNPALAAAKTVFHKHGVPQAAFEGIINDLYGGMAKDGTLAAPYSAQQEIKTYAEMHGLDAKQVTTHFKENEVFANGLMSQLADIPEKLRTSAQAELTALTDTAGGQALLRSLMGRLSQNGIRVAGEGQSSGPLSDGDLDKLTADPRIDPKNTNHQDTAKRFDPALRQQYDDGMAARGRKKYGAGGGGG